MRIPSLSVLLLALSSTSVYAASCTAGLPNLVANCGFETGDFTSWTLSGHDSAAGYQGIDYGVDAADAHSGSYGAYLGGFGGVLDLTQVLPTISGANYTISFWLAQSPSPVSQYPNSFSLSFGSASLSALNQVPNSPFTYYSFTSAASSSSTPLTFGFRDDAGLFSIDDISVSAVSSVPEPSSLSLWTLAGIVLVGYLTRAHRRGVL